MFSDTTKHVRWESLMRRNWEISNPVRNAPRQICTFITKKLRESWKKFKALEFNFDSSDKNHLVQKLSWKKQWSQFDFDGYCHTGWKLLKSKSHYAKFFLRCSRNKWLLQSNMAYARGGIQMVTYFITKKIISDKSISMNQKGTFVLHVDKGQTYLQNACDFWDKPSPGSWHTVSRWKKNVEETWLPPENDFEWSLSGSPSPWQLQLFSTLSIVIDIQMRRVTELIAVSLSNWPVGCSSYAWCHVHHWNYEVMQFVEDADANLYQCKFTVWEFLNLNCHCNIIQVSGNRWSVWSSIRRKFWWKITLKK